MSKNIIIACDGTGQGFGHTNSNVVKLVSSLYNENPNEQVCFYDAGLGIIPRSSFQFKTLHKIRAYLGFAFGIGLQDNVVKAYEFLMQNYEHGDKIYLFGYSRGAYTVRAFAGLLHWCGLLQKGNEHLIPYAYKLFSEPDFALCRAFTNSFCHKNIQIEFLGLFDTVSSVGWIDDFVTLPSTTNIKNCKIIRQAFSIDERRAFYVPRKISIDGKPRKANKKMPELVPDVRQVWFPGVHSDIGGGSFRNDEAQLSKVALKWMLAEASHHGLHICKRNYDYFFPKKSNKYQKVPDPNGKMYKSLKGFWWMMEFFPRQRFDRLENGKKTYHSEIPLGRRRTTFEGDYFHESVFQRKDYNPPNIPSHAKEMIHKTKDVLFHD